MKKVLVFLFVCLSSNILFAQHQTHWTPVQVGDKAMACICVLQIDGEVQKNQNLEIGVFSDDGECRGAKMPLYRSKSDQWIYMLLIKGIDGFTYTFRVYDHEAQQELSLTPMVSLAYEAGAKYGGVKNPYVLEFTTEELSPEVKSMKIEKN